MAENINKKKYYPWLDITKALGIFATITAHCYQANVYVLCWMTCIFPLFFVSTGYTIKPYESGKKLAIATWNDFKKMIIPSFFVFLLSGVYSWWTSSLRGEVPMWAHFVEKAKIFVSPDVPIMWFFIALFWGKLIYRVLLKVLPNFRTIPILVMVAWCLRFSPEHRMYLCLDVVPMVLLFIDSGKWLKQLDIFCEKNEEAVWYKKLKWPCIIVSDIVCVAIFYYFSYVKKYFMLISARDYTPETILQVLALMWLLVQASRLIQYTVIAKPFVALGKHTLGFVYLHFLDGYWLLPILSVVMGAMGIESELVLYLLRFAGLLIATAICVYIQRFVIDKFKKND